MDALLQLSIKKSDQIKKVLAPLKEYFDIEAVGFFKITRKGAFSYLTNRPEIMHDYAEKGLIAKDPFYRHPNFYQDQLIIIDQNVSTENLDPEISEYLRETSAIKADFTIFKSQAKAKAINSAIISIPPGSIIFCRTKN